MRGHRGEGAAEEGRPDGVFALEHVFDPAPKRIVMQRAADIDELQVVHFRQELLCAGPTAHSTEQVVNRESKRGKQHHDLDDIRPDHRTDAAGSGIDHGQHRNKNKRRRVEPELLGRRRLLTSDHRIKQDEQDGGNPQPSSAGQHARDEKGRRSHLPRGLAEASLQELINAHDVVRVKDRHEEKPHDQSCKYRPDGQLGIRVVLQRITLPRRAEERPGTGFRRQNAREHRPPCDLTVPQSKAFHAATLAALGEADPQNDGEVGNDDNDVGSERHGGA